MTDKTGGLLVALLAVTLAACGGPSTTEPTGPYAKDIKAAQAEAPSAFQRKIFADGKVTRAEYEEATDDYVKCLNSHGVAIGKSLTDSGTYIFAQAGAAAPSPWMPKCADETNSYVANIYEDMLRNPTHLDENDLMAQCLVRKKLAPAGYKGTDYAQDDAKSFKGASFSSEDPRFNECQDSPTSN